MEAKEYLMQLKDIDRLIASISDELEKAKAMAGPEGIRMSDTSTHGAGNVSDKTSDTAIKIMELERELEEQKKKYIEIKTTSTKLINQMTDNRYKVLLYQYYFANRTLEGTAGYMNRSYQNICKLHGQALQVFKKLMDAGKEQ